MSQNYDRCDAVWGASLHKSGDGDDDSPPPDVPYLIINNEIHPYHQEDYIVLRLTRQSHPLAYKLAAEEWVAGFDGGESYVKTWNPMLLSSFMLYDKQGRLEEATVDRIIVEMNRFLL